MLSTLTPFICALFVLTGADCAPGDAGGVTAATVPSTTAAAAVAGKTDWNDSLGTCAVAGTIIFKGEAPERKKLDTSSDGKCHGPDVLDETLIVGEGGGVQNVFVWVSDGLKDYKFETPKEPAILTQKGCTYIPHVLGIMEKQTLQILNEDETTHNVHSFSKKNKGFNQAQPMGAPALDKVFKRDEGLFQIKCDMHSWMGCWVAVVETPFFAVTDAAGKYDLGKLPPGTYEISFKHESLGTQKKSITVAGDAASTIDISFE